MFKKIGLGLSEIFRNRSRAVTAAILAVIMICTIAVLNSSSATVIIKDGDESIKFRSSETNPRSIVELAGISLAEEDLIYVDDSGNCPVLTIKRAIPVNIVANEYTATLKLASGTVSDALEKAGIILGEEDYLNFDLNDEITDNMVIEVNSVNYVYDVVTEQIPYETVTKSSASIAKGETQTTTAGENGTKELTYRTKLINGEVVESTVVSEKVTKEPVNEVKTIGTRTATPANVSANKVTGNTISELVPPSTINLDANGKPTNYTKVITGKATAYYNAYNRHCATGVWPKPGYIAVDPDVIPYGTKLYIVSSDGKYNYGYAIAADTGGFTSNGSSTVADLFFNTKGECIAFGRRQIEIYVLE